MMRDVAKYVPFNQSCPTRERAIVLLVCLHPILKLRSIFDAHVASGGSHIVD
jgi:hypothetical protein